MYSKIKSVLNNLQDSGTDIKTILPSTLHNILCAWTDDEYKKLIREIQENKTIKEIANSHGRFEHCINNHIKIIAYDLDNGYNGVDAIKQLTPPQIETYYQDKESRTKERQEQRKIELQNTQNIINADPLNIENTTVTNQGNPWTIEEDFKLKQNVEQRMTIDEIAQNHRRSVGAIRARLKWLNCKTTEKPQKQHFDVREEINNINARMNVINEKLDLIVKHLK